jgi:hypothetical protein
MRRVAAAALGLMLCLSGAAALAGSCDPGRADLRWKGGQASFRVEIADTEGERARGLMDRPTLAPDAGMLFVYEHPQPVAFWMRNTLIPLDMLFIGQDGRVRTVHADAVPGDETPIPGGDDIQFVLELPGGTAARMGIAPGTELHHPTVESRFAAWPCK